MDARVLEFRIPADTRYLSIVRRGVRSLAESAGFADEDVCDMELAVSEAVTNSVEHGCSHVGSGGVVVKCQAFRDCMVVEVEDQGSADSPLASPTEPDPAQEHGRGIMMIRTLMDEFEGSCTETGVRVRMAKQKCRR